MRMLVLVLRVMWMGLVIIVTPLLIKSLIVRIGLRLTNVPTGLLCSGAVS